MPPDTEANYRRRVTLALLGQKVDTLADLIHHMDEKLEKLDACTRSIENENATQAEQIKNMDSKINNWGILNTVGVVIAAILGAAGIRKP